MSGAEQLELPGPSRWGERDRLRQRVERWAARGVFWGTSSWKYEGWLGQLYTPERYAVRGKFSRLRFDRECLAEYATVFPTVCGDFSFYQFYPETFWQRLFAQVPASFQFGFKAPEAITAPVFPKLERYGAAAGQRNEHFLDFDLLQRQFLDRLARFRSQIGYLVFEFPRFLPGTFSSDSEFLECLDRFLGRLPDLFRYGVEIRTASLLGPHYFACLRRHRVAHVFNSWTWMPTIGEQLQLPGAFTTDVVISRVLLKPGRAYEESVRLFDPYDAIRDPYPQGYRDVAALVRAAQERTPRARAFLAVNNRFVGNAPLAISAILDELDAAPAE